MVILCLFVFSLRCP